MDETVFWLLVTAVLSGGLGWFLSYVFEKRPRLIVFYGHIATFAVELEEKQLRVNTHSVVIRNIGRRTANNVKLGHAVLPLNVEVAPPTSYETKRLQGTNAEIIFPKIVPGKQITLSYLYYGDLTYHYVNTYVESDEGPATFIPVLLVRQYPRWVSFLVWAFALFGIAVTLFAGWRLALRFFA